MKKKVLTYGLWVLALGWLLFSVYYIGRDYLTKYQANVLQSSYQLGYANSINSLILEAKKCQPVTAFNKDEKIELIWTECLKQNNADSAPTTSEAPAENAEANGG